MSGDIEEEKKSKQRHQELIDWRRGQVMQLVSKGKNLTQIAEILNVDVSTICRDYQYIRENAEVILEKYFAETVILEVTKCLARLTSISDEAWKMVEQADNQGDKKAKATAISSAHKAALDLVKILTDNHWLVGKAYRVKQEEEKKKEHEHSPSLASKHESESLNHKREGERERPIL
ncbi:MAG TPA: helix-turn-helix domain-containing protein [Nitrososphaera sp.]